MAVLAFFDDDRHSKTADVHRDSHGLTPFREVWPTACRCCAAPCRRWRRYQYSIIRHASQGYRYPAGRVLVQYKTTVATVDTIGHNYLDSYIY